MEVGHYKMDQTIIIGNRKIGANEPCFVIAEAGVNHNGKFELAKKLVDAAVEAGADAVKFQTFKAKNVVTNSAPMAAYQEKNIGIVKSQQEMLRELELSYDSFIELKSYCDKKGIMFLSTPHSEDAVDFLNDLVPAYKVGSGDLTNIPFLEKIAEKNKPIIIGTGMATISEIKEAIKAIYNKGSKKVILLHGTTNYPCPVNEVNLRAMQTIGISTNCIVGYSDHTSSELTPALAVTFGAKVVEKHFTLDKNLPGPDHKASLNPEELKKAIQNIKYAESIMGKAEKNPTESEKKMLGLVRKSIVAAVPIKKGMKITQDMLITKRPGTGIPPVQIKQIIGKIAKENIESDELILFEKLN